MSRRSEKADRLHTLIQTDGPSVRTSTQGFNRGRYDAVAELPDYEGLKRRARSIKEDAIDRLPELIDTLRETVESNGGTVYVAEDAEDARRHILDLTDGAERVAKSKSMTSEEIEINEALEEAGIEVVETDLGEWVLQIADESPSHIVTPAIHRSREDIAELFNRRFSPESPLETAEELTYFAREQLGRLIAGADVGMTGANFLIAESGSLVLVTSEGNARKSVFSTPTHIAIAGVEKILPRLSDLPPFLDLLGRSGTGQAITSYVSVLTPPVGPPHPEKGAPTEPLSETDRSFHLVLLDNGRSDLRSDPDLEETLYCIRCSACSNTCANFQHVGGHAFGGETYSGGIATGWEAGVHGLEAAEPSSELCTGCSRCVPACPVGIDIPWINTVVQDRLRANDDDERFAWLPGPLRPDSETGGFDLQKRIFGQFGRLVRIASRTAPLSNWMLGWSPVRALMERIAGVSRKREMPTFRRRTLRQWFADRSDRLRESAPRSDGDPTPVTLYADPYTNYVQVERGKAAVRILEALGYEVRLSAPLESGRAPLSQGLIDLARRQANTILEELEPDLEAGRPVLVIEPSDLAMFHRDYGRLVEEPAFRATRTGTEEIVSFIAQHIERSGANPASLLRAGNGTPILYHSHCQQRTLELERPTVELLSSLGYDVRTSTAECCGMAGSFGYKHEYYELSMEVGRSLLTEFEQHADGNMDEIPLVASGTSCMEQLEALTERPVRHPVELIVRGRKDPL